MLPVSRQVAIAITPKTLFIDFPLIYYPLNKLVRLYKIQVQQNGLYSCGVILAGLANFAVQTDTQNFNGVQQYNSRDCFQLNDGYQSADAHIGLVID